MDSDRFVEAVKRCVRDAAIGYTIANLKDPHGWLISAQERARSEWYNGLSPEEAGHVNSVVAAAVHAGLFRLFAALDGARTIGEAKGRFELIYVGDERVLLNDPQFIALRHLLNAPD